MQLLGFPVQLLGLFTIPLLVVRWGMDGVKPGDDVEKYTVSAAWLWPVCLDRVAECYKTSTSSCTGWSSAII